MLAPIIPEGSFRIHVKSLTRKAFTLEVSPWDTIALVKIKIKAMDGKLLPSFHLLALCFLNGI